MRRTYHIAYYQSKSNPDKEYEIIANLDQSGQAYLSCNCPSWTRGAQQTGKAPHMRTCKHCEAAWNEYKLPIVGANTEFYDGLKRIRNGVNTDFVWYRGGQNYSSRELLDTVLGLKRRNETELQKRQQQKQTASKPSKKKSNIESLSDALEFD